MTTPEISQDTAVLYENTLHRIARAIAPILAAIQRGIYGSRSVVGDNALLIRGDLEEAGIPIPLEEALKKIGEPNGLILTRDQLEGKVQELERQVRKLEIRLGVIES